MKAAQRESRGGRHENENLRKASTNFALDISPQPSLWSQSDDVRFSQAVKQLDEDMQREAGPSDEVTDKHRPRLLNLNEMLALLRNVMEQQCASQELRRMRH